jgi:hypothetical protein
MLAIKFSFSTIMILFACIGTQRECVGQSREVRIRQVTNPN